MRPVARCSRSRIEVIRYPESTKKTFTPMKPPPNPGTWKW